MPKQTTRDAALSRLFGSTAEEAPGPAPAAAPKDEDPGAETPKQPAQPKKPSSAPESEEGGGEAEAAQIAAMKPPQASGYIGLGRYTRADGVVERITPYVRPDQAEALRLAVARKNDPRGTDVSQIIQALLDEAGYRG